MQEMKRLLTESKNYLLFASLIFFLGSWIGYLFSHLFEAIIMQMLEQLVDIKEQLEGKSIFNMAWFIFQNNTKAALMMIGLGIILFFVPVFILFANGLALGYVLKAAAASGLPPTKMFLYGILPHGILELPAILIAGGIGLFLGMRLLRWLFGQNQFLSHLMGSTRGSVGDFWRERGLPILTIRLKAVVTLIIVLTLTLFVAAVIESFITPILIDHFVIIIK